MASQKTTTIEQVKPLTLWQVVIVVAGLVMVFLLSAVSKTTEGAVRAEALSQRGENVQTLDILKPTTNLLSGVGGAELTIVDNAMIGISSVLDSEEESYLELTGHESDSYIVQEGDTISGIANLFGISQSTIIWANKIKGGKIRVGQELVILPVSGVLHKIVKGDTVASLAKKYDGDVEEILSYNRIEKGQALVVGEEVTIPGGRVIETKVIAKKKTSSSGKPLVLSRGTSGLLETNYSGRTTWANGVRTTPLRGTGGPSYSDYYIKPISGYSKSRGLHGYNAIDFAAPQGTSITAAASGRVIVAKHGGWNGGYGKYVAIEHPNGTQTLYAHMSSVAVTEGDSVVQGQVIGYVGTTGNSSGNHLHFEVRGAKNPF